MTARDQEKQSKKDKQEKPIQNTFQEQAGTSFGLSLGIL